MGARLRTARFSVLQCSPSVSAIQRQCPICFSVPQSAVHRQCPICFSVLQSAVHRQCPLRPTVPQNAVHRQCPLRPTVPQSAVHRQCPLRPTVPQSAAHRQCPLRPSMPQNAVHHQCPLRSSVLQCCPSSASGKGHLLLPRFVARHGFLVSGHWFLVSGSMKHCSLVLVVDGGVLNGSPKLAWAREFALSSVSGHDLLVSRDTRATISLFLNCSLVMVHQSLSERKRAIVRIGGLAS